MKTTGALENCAELHALFIDLDFKDVPEAEARVRLGAFPLHPTMVVASGGGLHAYWLLKEPLVLPDEADTAKTLLRRLAHFFGGDLASAEPARVLRVPGSWNVKATYDPPRPVVLEAVA